MIFLPRDFSWNTKKTHFVVRVRLSSFWLLSSNKEENNPSAPSHEMTKLVYIEKVKKRRNERNKEKTFHFKESNTKEKSEGAGDGV